MVWFTGNTPPYFVVKAILTLAHADVKRKLSDSGKTVTV